MPHKTFTHQRAQRRLAPLPSELVSLRRLELALKARTYALTAFCEI